MPFAIMPETAMRWADYTEDIKSLPEKIKKKGDKKSKKKGKSKSQSKNGDKKKIAAILRVLRKKASAKTPNPLENRNINVPNPFFVGAFTAQ